MCYLPLYVFCGRHLLAAKLRRSARRFADFSWSRSIVGTGTGVSSANPRFVVTSLKCKAVPGRHLYEKIHCARGEMENRIKACQLDLFADRTSAHPMHANQPRLWFASAR